MRYFSEIDDFRTYDGNKNDFHFIYNANTGGGQSFLGGKYVDESGVSQKPEALKGKKATFALVYVDKIGVNKQVLLSHESVSYEIKPRAEGDSNMKLSVGNKPTPSSVIAALLMLPKTCGVKSSSDVAISALAQSNFWLQSMWLDVETMPNDVVVFKAKDCVFSGGINKQGQGRQRYFKVNIEQRIKDVISASLRANNEENDVAACLNYFAGVYEGRTSFDYSKAVDLITSSMAFLVEKYPEEYSGSMDPLPMMMKFQDKEVSHTGGSNSFIKQLLAAIRTKPFVLMAGISGTGKSRIVRQLARATVTAELQKGKDGGTLGDAERWSLHKPENFEIIQVKPNWHNSMDVVGYKTNIPKPHYEFTDFVRFVAKAWENPDVPFFLCLDEMNLAPVEQYFAEYLSAIESRERENGKYVTDAIIQPFEKFGSALCADMLDELFPKYKASADSEYKKRMESIISDIRIKGLTLPENLIVIGTVNMDETTFSFSRKVLDRAMSFVMNEVDFVGFLDGTTDNQIPLLMEQNKLFVNRPIAAAEVKDQVEADVIIDYLSEVNRVLDKTPFKLGYRAANEAFLYAAASMNFGQNDLAAALDDFTMMKILSRIEGDKSQLCVYKEDGSTKNLLDELKRVIETKLGKPAEGATETRKLKSVEKLSLMFAQLDQNGFVSYW